MRLFIRPSTDESASTLRYRTPDIEKMHSRWHRGMHSIESRHTKGVYIEAVRQDEVFFQDKLEYCAGGLRTSKIQMVETMQLERNVDRYERSRGESI
jgi:hypothetical protein